MLSPKQLSGFQLYSILHPGLCWGRRAGPAMPRAESCGLGRNLPVLQKPCWEVRNTKQIRNTKPRGLCPCEILPNPLQPREGRISPFSSVYLALLGPLSFSWQSLLVFRSLVWRSRSSGCARGSVGRAVLGRASQALLSTCRVWEWSLLPTAPAWAFPKAEPGLF